MLAVAAWTNLPYYLVAQASMAHAVGFFTVTASLHACVRLCARGTGKWAVAFGLFCGLSFLTRPQLAIGSALMFAYLAANGVPWRRLVLSACVCASVALIQLAVWYVLFGHWFVLPQGRGFLRFSDPQLWEVLFSRRHGLFLWHPFYLVATAGLLLPGMPTRLRWLSALVLAAQSYLNACVSDWWAGNAFGGRRFIDVLPFFSLGFAAVVQRVARWSPQPSRVLGVFLLLAVWNLLFVIQYRFGYIPRGQAITWQQLVTDKLRLLGFGHSPPRDYR